MDRRSDPQTSALVVLALLGALAALALMKAILVPLAFALLLACLLSPATHILRRVFRVGSTGAAVLLFVLLTFVGLYVASLTAESLVQAANTLPSPTWRRSAFALATLPLRPARSTNARREGSIPAPPVTLIARPAPDDFERRADGPPSLG